MIFLFSGEIASGKTTVSKILEEEYSYRRIRTGDYLKERAIERKISCDRVGLQEMGGLLDEETRGAWVSNLARSQITESNADSRWVLDSVRRDFQIDRFKEEFSRRVMHVHFLCPPEILKSRFDSRAISDERDLTVSYDLAKSSSTERYARDLVELADICFNSDSMAATSIAKIINTISLDTVGQV